MLAHQQQLQRQQHAMLHAQQLQQQQMMMGMPEDMIGAIKIKDGLFIGDEFAASVSLCFGNA